MVDVYEAICEISLGNDISIYPEIYLDMTYGKDKNILDVIHLRYGELDRFGITNIENDKSLFLNSDDSFEYREMDDFVVKFSMKVEEDNVNYNISLNKNSDINLVMDMIRNSINDAKLLKEDVKVLSKKIVKK